MDMASQREKLPRRIIAVAVTLCCAIASSCAPTTVANTPPYILTPCQPPEPTTVMLNPFELNLNPGLTPLNSYSVGLGSDSATVVDDEGDTVTATVSGPLVAKAVTGNGSFPTSAPEGTATVSISAGVLRVTFQSAPNQTTEHFRVRVGIPVRLTDAQGATADITAWIGYATYPANYFC